MWVCDWVLYDDVMERGEGDGEGEDGSRRWVRVGFLVAWGGFCGVGLLLGALRWCDGGKGRGRW